ncbi:TPA: OmpA family protein [Mannheimia haemolytica]
MKNILKLSSLSLAALLLAGCYASSDNYHKQAPVIKQEVVKEAPAPMPKAKEYVLSGDFLFDFDKSTLTSQGKSVLNNIAREIKQNGANRVTVTGYTDRLGDAAYNQKLSEQRANSAKNYLQSKGVKANINAVGKGKANQVKACKGEVGQALIDCLKPNRRVVIRAN